MASWDTMVIGVTGVIGSGKSTVCRYLEEKYGFHWIHADAIVHELYKFGGAGYKKIREYFGKNFVGPKGVLRGRLRQFILKTPQKLWILNQLIHPLVIHEVNKKVAAYSGKNLRFSPRARHSFAPLSRDSPPFPYSARLGNPRDPSLAHPVRICIEAIYFGPKDLGKFIDHLFIVYCPDEALLLRRLKHRKIPEKQLRTLIKFQQKILPKFGTKIINTGPKHDLFRQMADSPFLQTLQKNAG